MRHATATAAVGLLVLAAIGASPPVRAEPAQADRPNVLLIFGCQHSGWAMSCAGAEHLETPHLDRLTGEGVLLSNAYTTQPLCMPARVSMMSGRMPHVIGMTRNGKVKEVDAQYPLGRMMAEAGYATGWVGKTHLVSNVDAGFETIEKIWHNDAKVTRQASRFVERDRDRPFFLVASYMRTHDACELARKLGGFGRRTELPSGPLDDWPADAELPHLPDNFPIPPREPEVLRDVVWPAHPAAYPMTDSGAAAWRRFRWGYARLVEQMDARIGALLQTLRETGRMENTLVLYVAGHGDGSGAHRWNQKQVLYDEPARVPFIIRPPGGAERSRVDRTHLVSAMLDVMPTVLDYAGAPIPDDLRGRSVRPIVRDPDSDAGHPFVVTETTFGTWKRDWGVHGRMLRTQRYKYIVYNKGEHREQLFDMRNDPGEMRDLAAGEQHREALRRHRKLLWRWVRRTDDAAAAEWAVRPDSASE